MIKITYLPLIEWYLFRLTKLASWFAGLKIRTCEQSTHARTLGNPAMKRRGSVGFWLVLRLGLVS